MRRIAFFAVALLLVACASGGGGRPANVSQPQIRVQSVGSVYFGSGSSAPITFEIDITNRATVPIRLEELDLSSPGMVQWGIRPIRRTYNETIGAGETRMFTIAATAVTTMREPSEPLTVRTVAGFEANGQRWRELLLR